MDYLELSAHMKVRPGWPRVLQEQAVELVWIAVGHSVPVLVVGGWQESARRFEMTFFGDCGHMIGIANVSSSLKQSAFSQLGTEKRL